jgi:hypothetical protein
MKTGGLDVKIKRAVLVPAGLACMIFIGTMGLTTCATGTEHSGPGVKGTTGSENRAADTSASGNTGSGKAAAEYSEAAGNKTDAAESTAGNAAADGPKAVTEKQQPAPPFTVTDGRTGRIWLIYSAGQNGAAKPDAEVSIAGSPEILDWAAAQDYCTNLEADGISDWRLPTIFELISLYEIIEQESELIFPGSENAVYWSSTEEPYGILAFDFIQGNVAAFGPEEKLYVRAVSGGERDLMEEYLSEIEKYY